MKLPTLPPLEPKKSTELERKTSSLPSLDGSITKEENKIKEPVYDVTDDEISDSNDFSADYDNGDDTFILEEIDDDGNVVSEEQSPLFGMPEGFDADELLPTQGMTFEEMEEIDDFEDTEEIDDVIETKTKPKIKTNNGELNEEALEEFFANMKAKFTSLLKGKKSSSKLMATIVKIVIIIAVLLAVVFGIIKLIPTKGHSLPLDAPVAYETENMNVTINEAYFDGEELIVTIENDGDMSTDFDLYVTIKENKKFGGNKGLCSSDIIAIETGESATINLECDNIVGEEVNAEFSFIENQ